MKKRYGLEPNVICHIFKHGKRENNTQEPNDGSGGHATQNIANEISVYKIIGIPKAKITEAAIWFSDNVEGKASRILCPFPHIANFTFKNIKYVNKSMFPGNLKKDELIKTIERALSSNTPSHTYDGQGKVNSANGRPFVIGNNFERPLSDVVSGDYIEGRANGISILGQLAGGQGGITSVFPNTRNFHLR